jgi:hypothetical protein
MRRAFILVAAPIACALLAAGCGDDDSPSETVLTPTSGTPQTVTKADLLSEGDGICAEVNAAVGAVSASAVTDASSLASQRADLYDGMIDSLRALGTPSDDDGLDQFFDAGDDLVSAERDAELAAQRGDDSGLAEAETEAGSALDSFQSAAEAYGFSECGQPPEAVTPGDETATVPVPAGPGPTPLAPAPAPVPTTPAPPTGGAGEGGGDTGGGTGGGTGGVSP